MPGPKKKEAETQDGAEAVTETVQRIPLSELHPFEMYPFRVLCNGDIFAKPNRKPQNRSQ